MYTYVFKYFLDYSQNKKFIAPTYIVLSPIVKINYILIFYLKKRFSMAYLFAPSTNASIFLQYND